MKLLVCGSRTYSDRDFMQKVIVKLDPDVVIHGACRGADLMAKSIARELGIPDDPYPADWDRYDKAAGAIRNQRMLDEGRPDMIIAFFDGERTGGTMNMVKQARRAGVPVQEYGVPVQATLF